MHISTRHHSFWAVKTVSISDQKSFTTRWLYKERFYCITFQQSLTYRLRRRTTFCWCARCGRGVVWSSGGRHPYHSVSPDTCWRRYVRLPEPLTTAVPARLTPDVCIVETRLREPSYVPDHRYGSLDLGKNSKNQTLNETRIHSSGMRIGRLLTVSHSDACWEVNPPFPMWTEGMTDACENVTLPKFRLRAVIKGIKLWRIVPTQLRNTVGGHKIELVGTFIVQRASNN